MKMKRVAAPAAIAVITLVGALGAAVPAHAISRTNCGDIVRPLQIFSDKPTCWRDSGAAAVTLYNTIGLNSGGYSGRVVGVGLVYNFPRANTHYWSQTTVTSVIIN